MEGLTELFQLESKLAEAQGALGADQTALLLAQLELRTTQTTAEISIDDIRHLLSQYGAFNLSLSCNECHQTLFDDDERAAKGSLKEGLQPCCKRTFLQQSETTDIDVAFWWFVLNSFTSCMMSLPNYTRLMLERGVPSALRSRVWGIITQSADASGATDQYLSTLYRSLNKDVSPDISIIMKDVNRTFPEILTFCEYETKFKFENILNAYSIFDSDMGYCQGVQFIVAPLLFHFGDELKSFNALVKLFELNKLRTIYDNEMSGLTLWFFQFDKIMGVELPSLHSHFQSLDIDMNMFLSQWFLSFCSVTIPFNFLIRMFDVLLLEGAKETLFRVGITILAHNSKLLESIDDPEVIYQHLLSENCWGIFQNDVDDFISSMMSLDVTQYGTESLAKLEMEFSKLEGQKSTNKSFFNKVLDNFKSTAESVLSSHEESPKSLFSMANASQGSLEEDLELVEGLYKLCLERGIDDPILTRVKDRLSI